MKTQLATQLQAPATPAAAVQTVAEAHAAGVGGSYRVSKTGEVTLQGRTAGASVSRKAPLTDAAGNLVGAADLAADATTGTD